MIRFLAGAAGRGAVLFGIHAGGGSGRALKDFGEIALIVITDHLRDICQAQVGCPDQLPGFGDADIIQILIESNAGFPAEAVGAAKQRRICRAAGYYLYRNHRGKSIPVRFDVIAICADRVNWYQNAFDYKEG